MNEYQVIVGNVGTVYLGTNLSEALNDYHSYVASSKDGIGRCAYESVSLLMDGELMSEHVGPNDYIN